MTFERFKEMVKQDPEISVIIDTPEKFVCNLNAVGVVLASIISYSISAIISPLQTNLILNGKAKGIWNK